MYYEEHSLYEVPLWSYMFFVFSLITSSLLGGGFLHQDHHDRLRAASVSFNSRWRTKWIWLRTSRYNWQSPCVQNRAAMVMATHNTPAMLSCPGLVWCKLILLITGAWRASKSMIPFESFWVFTIGTCPQASKPEYPHWQMWFVMVDGKT